MVPFSFVLYEQLVSDVVVFNVWLLIGEGREERGELGGTLAPLKITSSEEEGLATVGEV